MPKFDAKSFNPQAFKYATGRIENLKKNEMRKSKVIARNESIRNVFATQDGTAYARIAMKGLLDGTPLNYDGETDITATSTKTFERGVVVIGRSKAWTEKDFADDISGQDFMDNVAAQVVEYWDEKEQDTMLAILEGIFSMTGGKSQEFVDLHTYDITLADDGMMKSTTLNSATQQACGDNKKKFAMAFLHSSVATNIENLNLIKHLTQTDKDGIERDLTLYTWNGKLVIVDDSMPYVDKDTHIEYTSYILGEGTFDYEDLGASVPYEMSRDPKTNGGQDTLYTRHRKVFAPYGISYEKVSQATASPTDAELKNGANWVLVNSGEALEADRTYINHRSVPITRIISKG